MPGAVHKTSKMAMTYATPSHEVETANEGGLNAMSKILKFKEIYSY